MAQDDPDPVEAGGTSAAQAGARGLLPSGTGAAAAPADPRRCRSHGMSVTSRCEVEAEAERVRARHLHVAELVDGGVVGVTRARCMLRPGIDRRLWGLRRTCMEERANPMGR